MSLRIASLVLLLVAGISHAADAWHVPAKGSAERAQIMDALRTELATFDPENRNLIFVVTELCVSDKAGWLSVEPHTRDGQNQLEPVHAVLKRRAEQWTVSRLACGEEECPKDTDPAALRTRVNPHCP